MDSQFSERGLLPQEWQVTNSVNGPPFACPFGPKAVVALPGQPMQLAVQVDQYSCLAGQVQSYDRYGYGCFTATFQPSKVPGVITSFYAFSGPNDGDRLHNEISVQFRGSETDRAHLSIWTDGRLAGTKAVPLGFDASAAPHAYQFQWSEAGISFQVDGRSLWVREAQWKGLASGLGGLSAPSDHVPTPDASRTELRIMANTWAVDDSARHVAGRFTASAKAVSYFHASRFSSTCNPSSTSSEGHADAA